MQQYLDLLRQVLRYGVCRATRARLLSTGQNVDALSLFGYQMRFDLRAGFPAVTVKKLAFAAVVHELLWFLSGSTNVKDLHKHNVTIWDEWADADGNLGPTYGQQWRRWPAGDGATVDQIAYLIRSIRLVREFPQAPLGRRLLLSAWNPAQLEQLAIPPCHVLAQFAVLRNELSCHLYQRSADAFLGVPFNIASYALLTHILAKLCDLGVGEFIHSFGDVHVYSNHLGQVQLVLERSPYQAPELWLDPALNSLDDLHYQQIRLQNYQYHPALPGEVAV